VAGKITGALVPYKSRRDPQKEQFWREHLGRQRRSGLSQAAYCRIHNLNANSFSSWKVIVMSRDEDTRKEKLAEKRSARAEMSRKLREKRLLAKNDTPVFVPLVIARTEPATQAPIEGAVVEIKLPGAAVLVYQGVDEETLRAVVTTFKECWFDRTEQH